MVKVVLKFKKNDINNSSKILSSFLVNKPTTKKNSIKMPTAKIIKEIDG